MTLNQLNSKKENLIKKLSREISKLVKANQQKVYEIVEDILQDLALDEGNLKFTSSNISLTNKVQREIDKFTAKSKNPFVKKIVEFANAIIAVDKEIYKLISKDFTNKVAKDARNLLFKSLGFDIKKKTLISGGYLDTIFSNKTFGNVVSQRLVQAISSRQGARTFKKTFKADFLGKGKNQLGFLERDFNTFTRNFLTQVDSSISNVYAQELELEWFIYAGTTVTDTRDFCTKRVGNIYSREFAKAWNNQDWRGKIQGVDFFIQVGGHNCRHSITYISLEMKEALEKQGYKVNQYN